MIYLHTTAPCVYYSFPSHREDVVYSTAVNFCNLTRGGASLSRRSPDFDPRRISALNAHGINVRCREKAQQGLFRVQTTILAHLSKKHREKYTIDIGTTLLYIFIGTHLKSYTHTLSVINNRIVAWSYRYIQENIPVLEKYYLTTRRQAPFPGNLADTYTNMKYVGHKGAISNTTTLFGWWWWWWWW